MLEALWWFITIQAIGLAAFPMLYRLLPWLKDRGYTLAKPFGLLFVGYVGWILSHFHILSNSRVSLIVLLLVLALASAGYLYLKRGEVYGFVVREWRTLAVSEAVFLVFFVGWLLYRAYDPAINTTEKPMDLAFLNASLQASFAPPEDPWLKGHPVSYYYFGYWMNASISKLTAISSSISYNIALASTAAMAAMGIFGLVHNLVRSEGRGWRTAAWVGGLGVVFLLLVGNLEGLLELLRLNGVGSQSFWDWVGIEGLSDPVQNGGLVSSEHWWWWRATRVIGTLGPAGESLDYTIQEFPFFSYLLGDLHPHAMSIPFVLLFMGLCLNLFLSPARVGPFWILRHPFYGLVLAVSLGALAFVNAWDIVTFSALLVGLVFLKSHASPRRGVVASAVNTGVLAAPIVAAAVWFYLPFYGTFTTQASAILPLDGPSTRPIHFLVIWPLFLVAVAPFFLDTLRKSVDRPGWIKKLSAGLFFALFPFFVWAFLHIEFQGGTSSDQIKKLVNTFPLMLLLIGAVLMTLVQARESTRPGRVYVSALLTLAILLIYGPELFYVSDFFGNRMNTVFKLYYQAWLLLATASAFGLYYWLKVLPRYDDWRKWAEPAWLTLLVLLMAGSLYYPFASAVSKADSFRGELTLDGLEYVAQSEPQEYEAIRWLRDNVAPESGILEAVGDAGNGRPGGDYNAIYGRISGSTGIPTVLGWFGHEHQWRGSTQPMEGRWEDVAAIYQSDDPSEAKRLLDKYRIEYVYVGPRERRRYGEDGLLKFDEFMDVVYPPDSTRSNAVVIYRLR